MYVPTNKIVVLLTIYVTQQLQLYKVHFVSNNQ